MSTKIIDGPVGEPHLTNNIIIPREDQDGPIFCGYNDETGKPHIDCYLDQYAIVPREVFEDLLEASGLDLNKYLTSTKGAEA